MLTLAPPQLDFLMRPGTRYLEIKVRASYGGALTRFAGLVLCVRWHGCCWPSTWGAGPEHTQSTASSHKKSANASSSEIGSDVGNVVLGSAVEGVAVEGLSVGAAVGLHSHIEQES